MKAVLNRRFVADDTARPTKQQHKKPCADCPFARKAIRGWLGNYTVEQWVAMVHGEAFINCHCTTNQQCAWAAIFRSNVHTVCRDATYLSLPHDTALVFADTQEFVEHHKR
jgi:hypothetical protein